jgi:hypothetical protein
MEFDNRRVPGERPEGLRVEFSNSYDLLSDGLCSHEKKFVGCPHVRINLGPLKLMSKSEHEFL